MVIGILLMLSINIGLAQTQIGSDIDGESPDDNFGSSVAINSDGNRMVVGANFNDGTASNAGHVRVYEYSNGSWVQLGDDIDGEAEGDNFGNSVSINSSGDRIIIGANFNDGTASNAGHARVYENSNGNWVQLGDDIDGEAEGDSFGHSVSINSSGNRIAIGGWANDGTASNAGHVRVYEYSGSSWAILGTDIDGEASEDYFGVSISLDEDGNRIAIGGDWNDGAGDKSGHVRVYEYSGGSWGMLGADIDGEAAGDQSGWSVSLNSAGNIVAIGARYNSNSGTASGHVRLYEYSDNSWSKLGDDIDGEAAGDHSGVSVSINSIGNRVVIGANYSDGAGNNAGHVRVYGVDFPFVSYVTSTTANGSYKSGDQINISVRFNKNIIVTGSPQISLNTGNSNSTSIADYDSLSGDSTLIFTYTIQQGDNSADLDYKSQNSLTLNGGTITSEDGSSAVLSLPTPGSTNSLGTNKDIVIDAIHPTVTSVTSSTADGTYKLGDQIDISVNFNENIIVSGDPQLRLNTGNGHLSFDGVNDYAKVDWNQNQSMDSYTVSLWIKSGDLSQTLHSAAFNNYSSTSNGFQISVDASNPNIYQFHTSSYDLNFGVSSMEWVHLALTSNGITTKLYYNGNLSTQADVVISSWDQIVFGRNRNESRYGNFDIDEVCIWNFPLTEEEIQTYKETPPNGTENGLISYWDFNTGGGSILTDKTTNGNNGDIHGATWGISSGTLIDYFSNSGNTVSFNYTVGEGHLINDLDYYSSSAISLNSGTIKDETGNNATITLPSPGSTNSLADNKALVIDGVIPTMTIAATNSSGTVLNNSSTTRDSTLILTFTSSEPTIDFTSVDITVNGGSVASFSGSGSSYTIIFTPDNDGIKTIDVSANRFTDSAGNNNKAAQTFNWTYDKTPPTISAVSLASDNSTISVTMSEKSYSTSNGGGTLEANDFSLSINGGDATLAYTTPHSISINENMVTLGIWLTGSPNGNEVLKVVPLVSSIYDSVGNEASISQSNNTVSLFKRSLSFIPAGESASFLKYNLNVSTTNGIDGTGGFSVVGSGFVSQWFLQISYDNGSTWDFLDMASASSGTWIGAGLFRPNSDGDFNVTWSHGRMSDELTDGGTIRLRIQNAHSSGWKFDPHNIYYPSELGSQYIVDLTQPFIVSSGIESNNANNTSYATIGDSAIITFLSSEPLDNTINPIVGSIAGLTASISGLNNNWSISDIINDHTEGNALFEISYYDTNGNQGSVSLSQDSNGEILIIDKSAPKASLNYNVSNTFVYDETSDDSGFDDGFLIFDGVDDYVDLDVINHDFSGGFTLSAWVFYNSFKSWSRIIDFDVGINTPQHNAILLANYGSSDNLTFEVYANGSSGGKVIANDALTTGEWIHVAASLDNSGNVILYKNGVEIHTGTTAVPAIVDRTSSYIGRSNWSNDGFFDGKIDNLVIWNRTLAASEILSSYNNSIDDNDPNLVGNWNFNNGSGSTLTDQSSSGNNGTINGGVWGGTSYTYVRKNDVVNILAYFNENIADDPIMQISGTGVDSIDAINMLKVSDSIYSHSWTVMDGDGKQTFNLLTGTDIAGNIILDIPVNSGNIMVDNTSPEFSLVSSVSSNGYDSSLSMVGDTVKVMMVTNENTRSPDVTIGGILATVSGSGTSWSAVRVLTAEDTEGPISLSIDYLDLAGNAGTQVTASTDGSVITFDRTSPIGSVVNDGLLNDIEYTGSNASLSANWNYFVDELTGINNYEYSIHESNINNELIPWVNIGSDTFFTSNNLILGNGNIYFISVRAIDNAGNVSSPITSNGVIVDLDGPIVGSINDGGSFDIDWTNSESILEANWDNFTDTLSGIQFYEYAIGTEVDSFIISDWKSSGLDTFFMESNLSLMSGEIYFVFVRATDNVNNTGYAIESDGITVDLILPEVEFVYDGYQGENLDWQSSDSTIIFHWSGSDTRDLYSYEYSIGTAPIDSNIVGWENIGSSTTAIIDDLDLIEGNIYFGNVRAFDSANNVSAVTSSDGITIDYTPPVAGTVSDGLENDLTFTGTPDSLTARWVGFNDSLSGILHLEYAVGTSPGDSDVVVWSTTIDSIIVERDLLLENGNTYYVSVRAVDRAMNVSAIGSSNGVVVDIIPPDIGLVSDGMDTDQDWTNSLNTLYGNWSGFLDTTSGIEYFEYAIGTETGYLDISEWTIVGLDTFFIRDDLDLLSGMNYYISVRAVDAVGNVSAIGTSDGITVDQVSPIVLDPMDGIGEQDLDWNSSNTTLSVYWRATDSRSRGLDTYEYSISTLTGDSNIVSWTNNGSDTAVTVTGLSLNEGITYFSNIRAFDKAGNRSMVVSSDGITIDTTRPSIGTLIDGHQLDIRYTPDANNLEALWSGFSDSLSGIAYYEAAAGTAPGWTDIVDWTYMSLDTFATFSELSLENGQAYYFSVKAIDHAFNYSEIVSSNGVIVDLQAPVTGMVFDGSGSDLDLLNQDNILQANWAGFYDSLSGIQDYQVSVGLSKLSDDQIPWFSVDSNRNYDFAELNLYDATTYFISVRSIDSVGNMSEAVTSDGITVDGTKPVITSQSIPVGTTVSLTDTFTIEYIYSESLQSVDLNVSEMISGTHNYSWEDEHIYLSFTGPFASMDSIQISLNVIDLVGNISESVKQNYYTEILADFNNDMIIDVNDLLQFIGAWENNNLDFEIGPISGTVPNFIPELDGTFNIRDAMAFRRIWHWSNSSAMKTISGNQLIGIPIVITQAGNQIVVSLSDKIKASQLAIQYPLDDMDFNYQSGISPEKELVVSKKIIEENVFLQLNGYMDPVDQKRDKDIIIDISGTPDYNIELILHYKFMGDNNLVISQGSYNLNFLPIPDEFALHQNYPNPFNPRTQIKYDLPEKSLVRLLIYDVLGREVAVLFDGEQEPGFHSIMWDGQNGMGKSVGAGMYFYSIQSDQFIQTRKMILLK